MMVRTTEIPSFLTEGRGTAAKRLRTASRTTTNSSTVVVDIFFDKGRMQRNVQKLGKNFVGPLRLIVRYRVPRHCGEQRLHH